MFLMFCEYDEFKRPVSWKCEALFYFLMSYLNLQLFDLDFFTHTYTSLHIYAANLLQD